jgi:hypothetical protein
MQLLRNCAAHHETCQQELLLWYYNLDSYCKPNRTRTPTFCGTLSCSTASSKPRFARAAPAYHTHCVQLSYHAEQPPPTQPLCTAPHTLKRASMSTTASLDSQCASRVCNNNTTYRKRYTRSAHFTHLLWHAELQHSLQQAPLCNSSTSIPESCAKATPCRPQPEGCLLLWHYSLHSHCDPNRTLHPPLVAR